MSTDEEITAIIKKIELDKWAALADMPHTFITHYNGMAIQLWTDSYGTATHTYLKFGNTTFVHNDLKNYCDEVQSIIEKKQAHAQAEKKAEILRLLKQAPPNFESEMPNALPK